MTAVAASPSAVKDLASTLANGAETLSARSVALRGAMEDFQTTRSEFGPTSSPVPEVLEAQRREMLELSADLNRFVIALRAADKAGAAISIGRLLRLPVHDLLLMDQAVLARFQPVESGTTVMDLANRARAERDAHLQHQPATTASLFREQREWSARLTELQVRLQQLETLIAPPHQRWAGVSGSRWTSARPLLDALQRGQTQARETLAESSADRAPEPTHPFLGAALEYNVLLTPGRVAILEDLDALATMPLADFVSARANGPSARPAFDWTSNGCSGPVPERGRDACLRHDFLYRNARMIRDQWGTARGLAVNIKHIADNAFGDELRASYPWWERAASPGLTLWIEGAEAAVTLLGDVGPAWNPPQAGRFFGSALP
ncbi:MAG: hypothetical protein ACC660_02540 [Acidimicrobiales bacterium]